MPLVEREMDLVGSTLVACDCRSCMKLDAMVVVMSDLQQHRCEHKRSKRELCDGFSDVGIHGTFNIVGQCGRSKGGGMLKSLE